MILDGWEGDPWWALSLASGWFLGCCWCQQISLWNIIVGPESRCPITLWHPNHCFSTIPIHLIHPQNDFGWLGRGSMGSKSCIRLVWVLLVSTNQLLVKYHCWARIQVSNHLMASKPLLLNHPNSLDTSPKWFWMVGKGIHGL
jgi:hypothetical protein